MAENLRDLSITDARDRFADVVNEAAYTGRVTYLTRRGRRLAAIVPVETAEAAERWEDEQLGRMAAESLAEMTRTGERPTPLDEVRDELAHALDAAASCWPGLSRAQTLVRLALEGHRAAQHANEDRRRRKVAALRKHSGMLTGAYGPDYLERMREDWPA